MPLAEHDVVAQRTKFFSMYKLGGHRIIINMKGDIIVSICPLLSQQLLTTAAAKFTDFHHLLHARLTLDPTMPPGACP